MPVFSLFKRSNSSAEKAFNETRNDNRKTAKQNATDVSNLQTEISNYDSSAGSTKDVSGSPTQTTTSSSIFSKKKNVQQQDKMPPPEEIMVLFEKLLKYHGITPTDKRHKIMMMKPMEEKWKLVRVMEQTKKEAEKLHTVKDTPEYITHRLKEEPSVGTVTELINLLKAVKSEDWIKKFLNLGGLDCLFQILVDSCDQQIQEQ